MRVDARTHGMEHCNMPPLTYASYLDLEKLLYASETALQPAGTR